MTLKDVFSCSMTQIRIALKFDTSKSIYILFSLFTTDALSH